MGVKTLVLTNAAGGINEGLKQGQLVLIADHINLSGRNPVVGANDDRLGPRFFDMSEGYSARLRELAHEAARSMEFRLDEGVYRRFARFGRWAPIWWVCRRCRKRLWRGIWAWRFSALAA
jgi:purine nucleoside phosphorylase